MGNFQIWGTILFIIQWVDCCDLLNTKNDTRTFNGLVQNPSQSGTSFLLTSSGFQARRDCTLGYTEAPTQVRKHIFNLHHSNSPIKLPRLPPLLKYLLLWFTWLIDQNFSHVTREKPLMKCCRYLKISATEFSTSFTATVGIEWQAVIIALKSFLVQKARKELISTQRIN